MSKKIQNPIVKKVASKITTLEEIVKVEAETILYFKIGYKENKVGLVSETGESYFAPLMKMIDVEKHEKFLKTYNVGLEYCKKMLKSFSIK